MNRFMFIPLTLSGLNGLPAISYRMRVSEASAWLAVQQLVVVS